MCPKAKKDTRRKKNLEKKPKGWQYPPPETEEEEDEALDEPSPQEESQIPMEPVTQGGSPQDQSDAKNHRGQADLIPDEGDISGNKCFHTLKNSNSDKDNAKLKVGIHLALLSSMPSQGEWRRVEKKKGWKD